MTVLFDSLTKMSGETDLDGK